jgi:NAD+ synthase (glutamine-hydrolysing)
VADPAFNVEQTIALAERADEAGVALALFPELGLTAYSNEDLFQQDALLDGALGAIDQVRSASERLTSVLLVGAPIRADGMLFNCGVALHRGAVLGVAPKSYIPNYKEFYEKRQFAAARDAISTDIDLLGERVPFGTDLLFKASDVEHFCFHLEVCEDVWVPIPPSTYAAFGGATVLANLSASNITIGKNDFRKTLCAGQSAKCLAAYLYSAAGPGESTTDLAWDGEALIYENGRLLAESARFTREPALITADVDLEALVQDRSRMTSYVDNRTDHRHQLTSTRQISFELTPPVEELELQRTVPRFPYVPVGREQRDERCYETYNIQVTSLVKRLEATGIEKLVVGISGGLDSTQALLVATRAMDMLGHPRANVLAYTMPGFATSETTLTNAHRLMRSLGVSAGEIDIRPGCMQALKDLDHPYARGEPVYDVTFENVQAGERTSRLFRLANYHGALVVGTGDLSELALGWATYGVGDHMSHYAVNASLPKSLIQYLIRWMGTSGEVGPETAEVLEAILDTEISPELVPAGESSQKDRPAQRSEETIGPYELQDFHLYYTSRYGFRPRKVAYLAWNAWRDRSSGLWPEELPEERRNEYSMPEIKRWLVEFLRRFIQTAQFKRSCLPNSPKVGSGGSLSPRGDWRAPSDAAANAWLRDIELVPDEV